MSILVKNNIHWVGQRDWERCAAAATTAISSVKKKMS